MKALMRMTRKKKDVRLKEVPIPKPNPNQVLIRVSAAGVCGTDIEFYNQEIPHDSRLSPPVILGHEGAGFIAAVGKEVRDLEIGQPVVADTTFEVCGHCKYCKRGDLNLCPERKGLGSAANGFFAPYTLVRKESVYPLNSSINTRIASITEPLACGVHAVLERAKIKPEDTIIIFGPGTMGLMCAIVASTIGAQSILIGTNHSKPRLEFAEKWGIAKTFNINEQSFDSVIRENLDYGADTVFECSGNLNAFKKGVDLLSSGGRLIALGEIEELFPVDVSALLIRREIELLGSKSSIPSSWRKAVELLPKLSDILEDMISYCLPLSQWQKAFSLVEKKENMKVILNPNEE